MKIDSPQILTPGITGSLFITNITNNPTGYFLSIDNTTGEVFKAVGGANGSSGTSGSSGSSGSTGTSGSSGSSGTSGSGGSSGTSGSGGSSGTSGSAGSSGTSGSAGSSGTSGSAGSSGTSGSAGTSGSGGSSGTSGSGGSSGSSGSSGTSGSSGSSGSSGLLNLTGSTPQGVITYNGYGNSATVQSDLRFSGSTLFVDGDLNVAGNAIFFSASYIYITSSQFIVGDNIITLNALSPYKRFAGLEMHDSGSSAMSSFLWDSMGNYFFVSGSSATNSQNKFILGPNNNGNLTTNVLPKATAGNQIGDSSITDTGTFVSINNNTQITGSLTTTGAVIAQSFTGSFSGSLAKGTYPITSSWSIYAVTASLALNGGTKLYTGSTYPITASWAVNALNGGTRVLTGSTYPITSSWALRSISSSYANNFGSSVTQSFVNSSTWTFTHLLGQRSVIIQAYNTNYDQILPANINLQNDNVAVITFPSPISGYAVATRGGRSITNFIPQTGSSYPITSSWAINATNLRGGQITSSGALINGNLKVNGTAIFFSASYIYVTSSQFIIGDNIITLNANSPYKRFAGIEMNDSGSSAKSSLLWDSLGNYFFVSGSTTTNSQNKLIVGPNNNVDLTTYYVPIATAGNKLGNSVIYNSGSNVGIGTSNPNAKLRVIGNVWANSFTGSFSGSLAKGTYPITSSWAINATNLRGGQITSSGALINGNLKVSGSLQTNNSISGSAMYTTNGKGRFYGSASYALNSLIGFTDSSPNYRTALGVGAGTSDTYAGKGPGNYNSAFGYKALNSNTGGINNSAFGAYALKVNITGGRNSAFGYKALASNTQYANSAFGAFALSNNTSGQRNSAFGYTVLISNTTGFGNSAFGYSSLKANTTGFSNSAFGAYALRSNSTGTANNAFGYKALQLNTFGYRNNAFGYLVLSSNTTGKCNNAFGHQTLRLNLSGINNNAFGYHALYNNSFGNRNNAFGHRALNVNTTGNNNNAFGYQSLTNNTTDNNNAFGYRALYKNTTGINNSAFGHQSLASNTIGNSNSAFGYLALGSNTIGYQNSAFGLYALRNNTSGIRNVAVGVSALLSNTFGNYNVAVGFQSLYFNTTGSSNTAVGFNALVNNNIGTSNNAFGRSALTNNTTGTQNSAFGNLALSSNTIGSNNNAFGNAALLNNTTNNNNAFGYFALASNTTGNRNSAFGHQSLNRNTTGISNSAFGYQSLDNNTIGYGNSAFGTKTLDANTTGYGNSAFGSGSLKNITTGFENIGFGINAGNNITTGNNNIVIGNNINVPVATGKNQVSIANIIFASGSAIGTGTTISSLNVGIGTTSPVYKLQVSGSIAPVGDGVYPLGNSNNRFSDVFAAQTTIGGLFETGLKTQDLGLCETGTIVSWVVDKCVPCEIEEDELVMGVVKHGKDEPLIMGAEPILVTGKVESGDYIVTSKKKGHGKAVKRGNIFKKDLFGKVIAQALQSGDGDSYLIKAMIRKM